jgi:beta-glucanase (GH16 family)
MKRAGFLRVVAGCTVLAAGLGAIVPQPALADPPPNSRGWNQVFFDDFTSFDTGKWSKGWPWGRTKNEAQAYVADDDIYTSYDQGLSVLTLRAQRRSYNYNGTVYPYTSGTVHGHQKYFRRYGYFECRAKMAVTSGTDSAFWLAGASRVWPPEIDIAEIPSGSQFGSGTRNYVGSYYTNGSGQATNAGNSSYAQLASGTFKDAYHTFGADWYPGQIDFYMDGRFIYSAKTNIPNEDMYMILSLEIFKEDSTWTGPASSGTYPQYMNIDWVKVWTRK